MKNRVFIILLLIVVSCSTQSGLVHKYRLDSSIENIKKNIQVIPFDDNIWNKLLDLSYIIDKSKNGRLPTIPFFMLIIKNDFGKLMGIKSIKLQYGDNLIEALSLKQIEQILKSPAYGYLKFENLLKKYRVINVYNIENIDNIDFSMSVMYDIEFIKPGDVIFQIFVFDWIPVNVREFTIKVYLLIGNEEKIIDYNINRLEYRTKGKHFLMKGVQNEDR